MKPSCEERLSEAVRQARAPVMLFDDTGKILLLSDAWRRWTGRPGREVNAIAEWAAGLPGGEAPAILRFFDVVIANGSANQAAQFRLDRQDGPRRWTFVASALGRLTDGHRLFICIANEVAEQGPAAAPADSANDDARFRQLIEALPAAVYTTDAGGRITFYNQAAANLWGYRPALGSLWCGSFRLYWPDGRPMPHDQCPMAVALKEDRPVRGAEAQVERPDGTRATFIPYPTPLHDAAGRLIGAVNMLVDITARKNAEQRLHVLAHEVDHRVKNMLAIIQGLVHFTRADSVQEFAAAIEGRVMGLARAHSLLSDSGWEGADLRQLVLNELAPYRSPHATRVTIDGASLMLAPAIAQSIALALHELVSNAAKYGALSEEGGRLAIRWSGQAGGSLNLQWEERGGPPTQPPRRRGFGLNLIERTVTDQLAGTAQFDWLPEGLTCRLQLPLRAPARFATA